MDGTGTGQAGVEGDEFDTGWLGSRVSVSFWEQVQEAAGNTGFIEKGQGGVSASVCQAGKGQPRNLHWVRGPVKSVLSYGGTSKDAAPFFLTGSGLQASTSSSNFYSVEGPSSTTFPVP